MRNRLAGLLLFCAVLSTTGCSAIFLNKPPPGDGPLPLGSCTMSKTAPIFDVIGTANYGIPALLPDDDLDELGLPTGAGARVFWIAAAGGLAWSAASGFKATSECRRRQLMSEQALLDHVRVLARNATQDNK